MLGWLHIQLQAQRLFLDADKVAARGHIADLEARGGFVLGDDRHAIEDGATLR